MITSGKSTHVAIACGGTGGHLFPGLAVGEELARRGCSVLLLISPKDVDQRAVKSAGSFCTATLPAVAPQPGHRLSFLGSMARSLRRSNSLFRTQRPALLLAMGGFASAAPVMAARLRGVPAYLHESNTVPGKANRFLARFAREIFVGFPSAQSRLRRARVQVTGTPVRSRFKPADVAKCRKALGLDPKEPVVFVSGGSQGASGVNRMVLAALPVARRKVPHWQWLHVAGGDDAAEVREAYAAAGLTAVVHTFLDRVDLALGAAAAAVTRAGASSLAELAAMGVPSVMVPYPHAADNHQFHNARAFEAVGAGLLMEQSGGRPEDLVRVLQGLVADPHVRRRMQAALASWHTPAAAGEICDALLGNGHRRSACQLTSKKTDASLRCSPSVVT